MIRISKETSHTLGSKPKPETTIVTQFLVYLSCLPPRGKTPVRGDSPVHPTGPRLWSTPILRRESSHPKVHRELGKQVLVLYTPTRRRKSGGCPTTGHGCRERTQQSGDVGTTPQPEVSRDPGRLENRNQNRVYVRGPEEVH